MNNHSTPNKAGSLQAPSKFSIVREVRALADLASVPFSLLQSRLSAKHAQDSLPVMMFPGFASDQRYLKPLEVFLRNKGYQTEDWGLGTNMAGMNMPHVLEDLSDRWDIELPADYTPETYNGDGGVPLLCDRAIERVQQRSAALNSPLVLVGWSLGGYIARECARELPDEVAQVITFGTPVIGGPKYSRAAAVFKAKNLDVDWIESQIAKRDVKPIEQKLTAIYSKSDGIVGWESTIDLTSPDVENIEIDAAHLGLGFNRTVWSLVSDTLAEGIIDRRQ